MTDDLDPKLQSWFHNTEKELVSEVFTTQILKKARFLKYRLPITLIGVALVFILSVLMLTPSLQQFVIILNYTFTMSLVDLGESWTAWLFSPINNLASILIVVVKIVRTFKKKIIGTSYA